MAVKSKNAGNFANNPTRAAEAGRKGGSVSGGNFANDPARAAEAGRKGGRRSHRGSNKDTTVTNG
ncbi:general stress protein [Pseudomonas sp. hsmgli-8]|uniref:General stress protein n=1 Tax=Pseudomonas quercus TaxID=2722792 RepID=A0ABX0YD58_9PSED|nr:MULTISPECIES: general stress protein [Pseudomonas]MBF7141622.1 general stress protein [Pseudomonas sp. LY10J]NJP00161.1 general stress protein [Pseudomonas quercus]